MRLKTWVCALVTEAPPGGSQGVAGKFMVSAVCTRVPVAVLATRRRPTLLVFLSPPCLSVCRWGRPALQRKGCWEAHLQGAGRPRPRLSTPVSSLASREVLPAPPTPTPAPHRGELCAVIYVAFWGLHRFQDGLRNVTYCFGNVCKYISYISLCNLKSHLQCFSVLILSV